MTQIIYSDIFPSNNEGVKGTAKPVITSEELDGILETIDYIYDDGILSVSEKISITIPLDGLLEASYSAVIARASELGLSYTALTTARSEYLAVRNALVPAWNNKGDASPLNGLDFRGKILAYQSAIKSAELAISREDARRAEWPLIPAGTGKPEDNADVTAGKIAAGIDQQGSLATKNWVQLGSDLRNALGTVTLQDFDVITGEAISAGELPNWNFGIIDKDGLPAGFDIVEQYDGTTREQVIEYTNFARAAVRLKGGRNYGAGFIAMPVDEKRTYLISIRHKSTGAHPTGLYIRMNERASAPPTGERYITAGNRTSVLDMRNNAPMPGTSWVEEVLSYTPTPGTKFASLTFYNWSTSVDYEIDYAHMSNSVFEGRLNALSTLNGPMEAGANVTEGRISYGFLGQTPWATLTSNIGRVSRLDDTGTLQAQNIYNPGIAFLDQRWPAELGSNVTETRIAQGIQFQGALATANQASWTAQISGRPVELTDGRIGSGLNAAGFLKSGINAGGPLSLSPSEVFSLLAGTSIAYDPEFQRGVLPNEISVYNNAGTSTVSLSVITDQTAPNGSKKVLRVSYNATDTTFPGYGGFTRLVADAGAGAPSRTNRYARGATYLVKVVAKIPTGRTINFASNPYGDGGDFIWLTSQEGTGNYETYFARQQIGKTGSFQQTGYFFIDGGPNTAFTWDVAISDYIEMTGANRVFLDQGIITGADGVVRLQNQLVTSEGIASAINNQGALATLNNINLDNPAVVTLPGRLAPSPIHGGGWLSAVNVAWEDLGGGTVHQWKPQEPAANITESRISQGFSGQTPWATLTSNIGRVSRLDDTGTLQAQNIYNPGIAFLDQRWPAELGSNVTENRIAQGIQFQGPGATASGNDVLNNRRENEVLRIPKPVGASYSSPNAIAPGSIRIRLPVSWSYTMLQFTVDIFDYSTNRTVSLVIAGYNYGGDEAGTPAQWFNWSAHITGGEGQRFPVYFGYSSGLCTIWIGNTSNLWQYPKVTVRDFMAGHTNYELSQWDDGWIIDLDTTGPRNETGGPVHSVLHPTPGDALFGSNIFEGSGLGVATTSNFKTQLGTSAAIANQGAFATINQVDLDNTARFTQPPRFEASAFGGTWFRADRVAWGAGNTVESFKPQEPSANITENRISSGIAGQGVLATANNISYEGPVITGKPTNIGNRSIIPGERFDNSFPWDRQLNIVQLPDEPAVLSTAANPQSFLTNFGNAQPVDQEATYEYTYEVYQDGPNKANWYSVICMYDASQNHLSGDGSYWHYPAPLVQAIEPYRWIKYAHRFGRGGVKEIPTNAVRMGMGMLLSFGGSGDPMYVRRMCVRKIPYLDWTDPGDGRLSFDVGSVTKNYGWEGLWGAVTTSRNSITGPQTISAMATTDALGYANSMFGLTDGPVTNYSNIDYAWHPQQFGLASIYENGVFIQQIDIGNFGLNFTNAKFSIEYDGLRITYMVNGIVIRRITTSANRGFRGAIDINSPGAGLSQIEHYSTNSLSIVGDNTFRANGNFLGTASLITSEGTAAAIANQGALATVNIVDVDNPSQVARPSRLDPSPQHGVGYLAADRVAYAAGNTTESLRPEDIASNRTENRIASGIAGQKSGATSASLSEMNAKEGLRLKGLDDTNNMIRNSFDLSDVIFEGGAVFREANPNGAGPARDNFRVRHDPNSSLSYFNSGDFIPVRPNERLYAEFTVYHAANTGAYGRFYLKFYSTNNTYLGDVILSHGSENGTGDWFRRKFAGAVPANAAKMLVFTYTGSDHTSGSIYFTEPFLSRYEEGSDVTSAITGAATITIKHDSAGTALSGQLPRQEQYRLIRNGVDVTSQSTWTVEVISGTVSGAVNSSNGLVQINSITSSAKLRLTATYLSTIRRMEIDVVREVATPSYGGGGAANDTTLSSVSSTSHNPVSNELSIVCGGSGVVNISLTAETLAQLAAPAGTFNVYAVAEEWNGSSWVELHSEVLGNATTGVTLESGIYYSDGTGAISFYISVGGRSPGATYQYRLKARATANKFISFQNANFQVSSGN